MGSSLHFIFPILLILGGVFGLILLDTPKAKVGSFALFQFGWLIALFQLEPRGGAMTWGLGVILGLVTLGVLAVLWALGQRILAADPDASKAASRKGAK